MSDSISITIAICTFNRAKYLAVTLNSIAEMVKGDVKYELIVIDNNSSDNTASIVKNSRYIGLIYHLERNQGLSHARNHAISIAKGDYIAFLDDDVIVDKLWLVNLQKLLKICKETNVNIIGGRVKLLYESGKPQWMNEDMENYLSKLDYEKEGFVKFPKQHIVGANFIFKTVLFSKKKFNINLGRIGSKQLSGEEIEICIFFQLSGQKIFYSPEISVEHIIPQERATEKYLLERVKWGVFSDLAIHYNPTWYHNSILFSITVIKILILLVLYTFNKDKVIYNKFRLMREYSKLLFLFRRKEIFL